LQPSRTSAAAGGGRALPHRGTDASGHRRRSSGDDRDRPEGGSRSSTARWSASSLHAARTAEQRRRHAGSEGCARDTCSSVKTAGPHSRLKTRSKRALGTAQRRSRDPDRNRLQPADHLARRFRPRIDHRYFERQAREEMRRTNRRTRSRSKHSPSKAGGRDIAGGFGRNASAARHPFRIIVAYRQYAALERRRPGAGLLGDAAQRSPGNPTPGRSVISKTRNTLSIRGRQRRRRQREIARMLHVGNGFPERDPPRARLAAGRTNRGKTAKRRRLRRPLADRCAQPITTQFIANDVVYILMLASLEIPDGISFSPEDYEYVEVLVHFFSRHLEAERAQGALRAAEVRTRRHAGVSQRCGASQQPTIARTRSHTLDAPASGGGNSSAPAVSRLLGRIDGDEVV